MMAGACFFVTSTHSCKNSYLSSTSPFLPMSRSTENLSSSASCTPPLSGSITSCCSGWLMPCKASPMQSAFNATGLNVYPRILQILALTRKMIPQLSATDPAPAPCASSLCSNCSLSSSSSSANSIARFRFLKVKARG
jgi:hypothetical protein